MTINLSVLEELAKSKVKVKAAARKLEIQTLEKLISSLNSALEIEKARLKEKSEKERQKKIEKINQLLSDNGLDISDLKGAAAKPAKKGSSKQRSKKASKRGPVPPKYRLEIDGVEHLWSGRGRTPLVFADYFSKGNSRDSVTID